jgi:hypothetical protein
VGADPIGFNHAPISGLADAIEHPIFQLLDRRRVALSRNVLVCHHALLTSSSLLVPRFLGWTIISLVNIWIA